MQTIIYLLMQQQMIDNNKVQNKMLTKLIVALVLICRLNASYIPQMNLATSADFFNKQISLTAGPIISKFITNFHAPNISIDKTIDLIHVKMNMTNITQSAEINWNANILNVTGEYAFDVHAKNINVTVKAEHFQYHLVVDRVGQKGELEVGLEGVDVRAGVRFVRTECPNSIGFGVEIAELALDPTKLKINVVFKNKEGKEIDKRVIKLLQKLIIQKLPNIINTNIRQSLNQQIHTLTCNGLIEQILPIGTQQYLLSINTTDVPHFAANKFLTIPVDINFKNLKTNATNEETLNENLVDGHVYEDRANVTATVSSNMVDTLVWLVDDSNLVSQVVTKDMLGPDAPISLDTTGLSILLPGLKKFPNKDVILRINTSSEFSEVFIRSGRLLSGFSISADFIINETTRYHDVDKCLAYNECFVATSLNITLGVSASVRVQKFTYLTGLIQALYIHEIKVIESMIDVKVPNLMKILNPLISSARPQINNMLQQGIQINVGAIQQLKKLNVTGIVGEAFLDYASFGVLFDLEE